MLLCAAGDIHGAIERLYRDVLAFESALSRRFELVVHVGDFGIWPDAERVDRATREHEGAGDFPAWHAERRAVPRRTVFIKGNHEDFSWLEGRGGTEVLPGLTYLRNGEVLEIADASGSESLRIGGIGGCFGPSNYERPSSQLHGYAQRHFTRDEVQRLCDRGPLDVLLLHDAPAGVEFVRKRADAEQHYVSEAVGLAEAIRGTRPRVCFFGHHHRRVDAEVGGVRCIGLNIVGRAGNLVAFEIDAKQPGFQLQGEWPS